MAEQPVEDQENELQVTFFPPLYLQRRIWIFDIMRHENITDILDVGCGEGEMLCALCNTAPWLSSPNDTSDKFKYLHPRHIRGLDISATDLEYTVKYTSPPSPQRQTDRFVNSSIRWEPLRVDIWKGGLETINEQFIGIECIVSSEVIEHLPEDVLPKFALSLLGVYHPRFLLITTPSYTFNARFSPPEPIPTGQIRPGGYPDPTGRTDRVFRHSDHKFEWTVDEFTDWCNTVAEEWEYQVDLGGVGRPLEKDAWGRDDQCGCGSQVAVFRRIEGDAAARSREKKVAEMLGNTKRQCNHELLATYHHDSHPSAGNPSSSEEILEKVTAEMEGCKCSRLTIQELWRADEIAITCGGRVDELIESVEECPTKEFILHRDQKHNWREEWQIELVGGVQRKEDLWAKEVEETDPLEPELQYIQGSNLIVDTSEEIMNHDDGVACICSWGFTESEETWGTTGARDAGAWETGAWETAPTWGVEKE